MSNPHNDPDCYPRTKYLARAGAWVMPLSLPRILGSFYSYEFVGRGQMGLTQAENIGQDRPETLRTADTVGRCLLSRHLLPIESNLFQYHLLFSKPVLCQYSRESQVAEFLPFGELSLPLYPPACLVYVKRGIDGRRRHEAFTQGFRIG